MQQPFPRLTRGVDPLGPHPGVVDALLNDPVEDLLFLLAVVYHLPLCGHNPELGKNLISGPRLLAQYSKDCRAIP